MPPKKAVAGAQLAEGKGKCVHCAVAAERICQRCGDYYCSKDCQVQDWPRHRYICIPLPALVYPKSHSVFQSSHELSLEVDSDKTVVGATLAPSPSLIPDVEGNKICSTSNIAPQNKVPILPTPPTQLISNNSGNKAKNKNISLPNAIMPPSNSLVFMMAFKSANRCYIRDAREVADRAFAQMCEKVNTIGNELPRMVKPRPFGFCLARHNGTFQRAKTMNVFGNHSARLQLLDHGVVKSRTISDMREINDELLSLPCFTLQVQLKDVPNYAISDDFFAFISQFEGEMYVAVHEKTPGCIQVELLHPETKMSLNAKIREYCANKKIYENMNSYKKNEKLNRPNPPSGQQTTKDNKNLASPVVNNSLAVSQGSQMFTQEFLKMPETEVKNQSDPKNSLSFSDKNKETPKNPSPTTGQESISQNQSKPVSEVGNNTPAKVSLKNKETEVSIQSDQIQGVTAASTQETIKKDEPSDLFGSYFKQRGITEQDLKKMSPSEVFSVFFGSRANIKDSKETPTVDLSKDLSVNHENNIPKKPAVEDLFSVFFGSRADIKDSKETSTVDLSKDLSVNQENNIDKKPAVEESKKAENIISKTLVGSTTKEEGASSLEIKKLSNLTLEVPSNDEKPTTVDQAIKPAPEIVSKPKDEEVKEFLSKCLAAKITHPSENSKSDRAVPLELPKLKELLDSLSISKANPQENGIVRKKNEALLKPPFELRRFTTHSKEGIDIYVVDSSKKDRGIFGAFDSTYAGEFSTLHSRLSVITDSDPYIPQLREYVLARFEGSWYRGRVEQIITIPQHPTKYRVMYLDYTNVEDIYEIDIRRYPLDFTTPCTTNICVIEDFPHKPNAAQISFLSHALKVHQLVHVDSVNYLNNIAIIKSRSLIQKLLSL